MKNLLAWKSRSASEMAPSATYPGMAPLPPSKGDATQVIWHDPSTYDPYFHGPPYLPGVQGHLDRTASMKSSAELVVAGQELPVALTLLRALGVVHQTHHWLTKGPNYYADHLLFERVYSPLAEEIDSLAERAVGTGSPSVLLHPAIQARKVAEIVESLCDGVDYEEGANTESYVAASLRAEQWFVSFMKKVAESMKASGTLSRGMDNLLAGIEDKHEEHIYLLSQRHKTASDPWKITE